MWLGCRPDPLHRLGLTVMMLHSLALVHPEHTAARRALAAASCLLCPGEYLYV